MSERDFETGPYTLREELPSVEEFVTLRAVNDMTPRPDEAVERGLPNSLFGVTAVHEPDGDTVGMGRIIGDGGTVYQLTDMAVHPDHQRLGIGAGMLNRLLEFVEETAPGKAEVNLFADVDGFYERFGFDETRPASKGMVRFVE